jgi:serine O-acetyltransferase
MKNLNPLSTRLLIWSTRHAPQVLWRAIAILLGSDVACKLPKSTIMGHPYGIIIHSQAFIGEGVTISQNVTIGSRHEDVIEVPRIEDGVLIGTGAILIGNITIGAHAKIGAGAVVINDVPPFTTVVGNPARPVAAKAPSIL